MNNILYVMRGTSCSGKSTMIDSLRGYKDSTDHCVLSSDKQREYLCGDIACQKHNRLVFDTLRVMCEHRMMKGIKEIFLDSTAIKLKDVMGFFELALKYNYSIEVISIIPPTLEELMRRNQKRYEKTGFLIPDFVFEKHIDGYYQHLPDFAYLNCQDDDRFGVDNYKFRQIDSVNF